MKFWRFRKASEGQQNGADAGTRITSSDYECLWLPVCVTFRQILPRIDSHFCVNECGELALIALPDEFASEALMRAARWFLKHSEFEEAASLYAVGIAIAGVGPEDNMIKRLSKACLTMAFHIQIEASGQEKLYEQVVDQLNNSYNGIGEHLRELINLARRHATEFENSQQ